MEKIQLPKLRNWQGFQDENNVFWLTFDKQDSVNTLDSESLSEFKEILDSLEKARPCGLCIRSGKKNGFIAGADILQIRDVETVDDAFALIQQGQTVFQQLAGLPFPTLALIQGYCLGGGLELALACRYRVAIDDPKTKLGLPEVMLGIHPGWGGTVRLPRLIGPKLAFHMILSGKSISGNEAQKIGLVDFCVPIWDADRAVLHFMKKPEGKNESPGKNNPTGKNTSGVKPTTGSANFNQLIKKFNDNLYQLKPFRILLGRIMEWNLAKKVNRHHYPAPFAVIENWQTYGVATDEAFSVEAHSVSRLMITDCTRNMVRVFDLQEKLKSLFREVHYQPNHVHVIGAGVMGGDIAAWCALKGIQVSLEDQNIEAIAKALGRALKLFKKKLSAPHLVRAAMDRLIGDSRGEGIAKADIIFEAIIENKEAKQQLFRALEKKASPNAIFATNTSTIPLEEIAGVMQDPSRLVGLHFFNPVAMMPLVEVILVKEHREMHHRDKDQHTEKFSSERRDKLPELCSFVRSLDKLPLPVKSTPGFLVNRVLMPYLLESMRILEEGVPAEVIDHALKEFGMPMGPIELIDTVGLDVCLFAFESLKQDRSLHIEEVPNRLSKLVAAGFLGKKTGRGFYQYNNKGKPMIKSVDAKYRVPEDITDRAILRMVNEAVACLREKVVTDADLIDAGMIFGIGFPAFRGGPIHYALEQGEGLMLQRLNMLAQRYGDRFLADSGWGQLDAA